MPVGRKIGYARVDATDCRDQLISWTGRLRRLGVHKVFTDVGPLLTARTGLLHAIRMMKMDDVLVFPNDCLQELEIGNIPHLFAGIPEGGRLYFFEGNRETGSGRFGDFGTIRLSGTAQLTNS